MEMLGSETFEGQYFPSSEYYIKYDVSLPENLERTNLSFHLFASLCIIYLTEFATALRHLVIYLSIKVELGALPHREKCGCLKY